MFGINTPELLIIIAVALLVIGPQRLPEYLEKTKNLIREARKMASGARETIKDEAGIDIDDIDWKKLDPRQYDPRRIIRDALLDEDDVETLKSAKTAPAAALAAMMGRDEESARPAETNDDGPAPQPAVTVGATAGPVVERLAEGQRAPFDIEAT
ncbi:twin-arginine translocase TatA/TatE family subunit [Specibacter cremeus]|uniref:twin-arginine translocase TatA/TatE family subunit n=1 Tax=Specibacter cremeus TaxID=1629051 RepID=UPI000F768AFE|nr:twin-arginine translocase TatA/TatE family subunit [Specibacter cremeus]